MCASICAFPTAGETSGIAMRMMGIGKPVIVHCRGRDRAHPENACLRVDPGPAEEEMLADTILWLAGDRDAAVEIGRRAAAHIAATTRHRKSRRACTGKRLKVEKRSIKS